MSITTYDFSKEGLFGESFWRVRIVFEELTQPLCPEVNDCIGIGVFACNGICIYALLEILEDVMKRRFSGGHRKVPVTG